MIRLFIVLLWLSFAILIASAFAEKPQCPFCARQDLRCRVKRYVCTNTWISVKVPGARKNEPSYEVMCDGKELFVTGCGAVFSNTK